MSGSRLRLSATARVTLAVVAAIALGVLAMSAIAYLGITSRLSAELDSRLTREVRSFSEAVSEEGQAEGALDDVVRRYLGLRQSPGAASLALVVRFRDGRVLSNTDLRLEDASGNESILRADAEASGLASVALDGEEWRVAYATVFTQDGEAVAVFEAGEPISSNRALAREVMWTLLASGLAAVLLGALASAFVARASLAPLREASRSVSRVGHTNLAHRIGYEGPVDEIGVMVATVNSMLDRMETAFGEQRRFVAEASHELRTPLAVIRGHLDIAADARVSQPERADSLSVAVEEVERMARLVDDMLTLARLEGGPARDHQLLDVGLLAWEATQKMSPLSTVRITSVVTGHHWVEGDPEQLLQVLLNLISNAVGHSPEDGEVQVSCESTSRTVRVAVEDEGRGIDEDDISRVFDRFFRGKAAGESRDAGIGLGLAIAASIVHAHKGGIWAANRPEGGARFEFELPKAAPPKRSDRGTRSAQEVYSEAGRRRGG